MQRVNAPLICFCLNSVSNVPHIAVMQQNLSGFGPNFGPELGHCLQVYIVTGLVQPTSGWMAAPRKKEQTNGNSRTSEPAHQGREQTREHGYSTPSGHIQTQTDTDGIYRFRQHLIAGFCCFWTSKGRFGIDADHTGEFGRATLDNTSNRLLYQLIFSSYLVQSLQTIDWKTNSFQRFSL